eukprot:518838-Amphidinium_carterae.1
MHRGILRSMFLWFGGRTREDVTSQDFMNPKVRFRASAYSLLMKSTEADAARNKRHFKPAMENKCQLSWMVIAPWRIAVVGVESISDSNQGLLNYMQIKPLA